jgi:hypothetical protein
MHPPRPASRWLVWSVAALALLVAAQAFVEAVRYYGQPIAGVLVDPNAVVSTMGPSTWAAKRIGLSFPDRVVEVEGLSLRLPSGATRRPSRSRERAARANRSRSTSRPDQSRPPSRTPPIHPLDGVAW